MIPEIAFEFSATIWIYQGKAAWHFITLPTKTAKHIRGLISGPRRGWGAVRVKASIGDTSWATSIFPYKEVESYILPIKASVRKAEGIRVGDNVSVVLTFIDT
jgi:hypothetical protein